MADLPLGPIAEMAATDPSGIALVDGSSVRTWTRGRGRAAGRSGSDAGRCARPRPAVGSARRQRLAHAPRARGRADGRRRHGGRVPSADPAGAERPGRGLHDGRPHRRSGRCRNGGGRTRGRARQPRSCCTPVPAVDVRAPGPARPGRRGWPRRPRSWTSPTAPPARRWSTRRAPPAGRAARRPAGCWRRSTTHRQYLDKLRERAQFPDGAHLVVGPLQHNGPLTAVRHLLLGRPVVIVGRFDAAAVLGLIDTYRVTSSVMVPTHFSASAGRRSGACARPPTSAACSSSRTPAPPAPRT